MLSKSQECLHTLDLDLPDADLWNSTARVPFRAGSKNMWEALDSLRPRPATVFGGRRRVVGPKILFDRPLGTLSLVHQISPVGWPLVETRAESRCGGCGRRGGNVQSARVSGRPVVTVKENGGREKTRG